ncbi:thiolase family protein [Actinomadura rugatobispora]|uniref:Thiolase family protein n=1 Tax=Actinomadura rugatobispora TaxID=1994 RepID=A0ABW1A2P9_9ACTN|nr:thiolase family protein [Actinomadura rugatobispora]
MREAVLVDAVRTPFGRGRPGGILSGWHPVDLLATTLAAVVDRQGIDPATVDDVIVGCVSQVGEQSFNIARGGVLGAGFPVSVPATTVDRQCGSSQQALHFAAQGVIAGAYDVVIAAGVESMSRVPMFSSRGDADPNGTMVAARFGDSLVQQGVSAELIAQRWGLSRGALDAFAERSHRLAAKAGPSGEVLPVEMDRGDGRHGEFTTLDEGVRPETTAEGISRLRPAFRTDELARRFPELDWKITAATSSQISDGAAALLVMERATAERLGVPVRAIVRAFSVVGDDPTLMLTGVIPATRKVLASAGLTIDDIDVFEVNEAFAPVVLAWQQETGADLERVNVHGGAIANGHPLGASGAKLMSSLLAALDERGGRWGLQTICEGGGMANATIVERVA